MLLKIKFRYLIITGLLAACMICGTTAYATPLATESASTYPYSAFSGHVMQAHAHYYHFHHYRPYFRYRTPFRFYGYYPHHPVNYGYYRFRHYYGYWRHHLPRHYFYPKYDRANAYYYPADYRATYPVVSAPRMTYVIGDAAAPEGTDKTSVVRIVSGREPEGAIRAQITMGRLAMKSGEYRAASARFLKAMALSPGNVEARTMYAMACVAQKRWTEAAFAFKRAIRRDPELKRITTLILNAATVPTHETFCGNTDDATLDPSVTFVYGLLCAVNGQGHEAKLIFAQLRDCREAAAVEKWLRRKYPAEPKNS